MQPFLSAHRSFLVQLLAETKDFSKALKMEFSLKRSCVIVVVLFLFSALAAEGRRVGDDGGWVTVNGGRFELNGSPFLFNGFNAYWLMHVAADAGQRGKVTEVLREASAAGLTVCRTWAFSEGNDPTALQTSPGVYNEGVFQVKILYRIFKHH